jgi:hypothetical protein
MGGMRILWAAFLYFAIVFGTGFVVGPVRVLVLEPRLGALAAVLIEAPILVAAMIIGAKLVLRRVGVVRPGELIAVGIVALLLQQVADVALGIVLRGMTIGDPWSHFLTTPGLAYVALLTAFALMPWVVGRRERR